MIAAFTLARAAGASFREAAILANAAAGVVVGKVGVATCSPEELVEQMSGGKLGAQGVRSRELGVRGKKETSRPRAPNS